MASAAGGNGRASQVRMPVAASRRASCVASPDRRRSGSRARNAERDSTKECVDGRAKAEADADADDNQLAGSDVGTVRSRVLV